MRDAYDDILTFSCEQVEDLLIGSGFSQEVASLFMQNDINGQVLNKHIKTHSDLKQIGITNFGTRCLILDLLKSLFPDRNLSPQVFSPSPPRNPDLKNGSLKTTPPLNGKKLLFDVISLSSSTASKESSSCPTPLSSTSKHYIRIPNLKASSVDEVTILDKSPRHSKGSSSTNQVVESISQPTISRRRPLDDSDDMEMDLIITDDEVVTAAQDNQEAKENREVVEDTLDWRRIPTVQESAPIQTRLASLGVIMPSSSSPPLSPNNNKISIRIKSPHLSKKLNSLSIQNLLYNNEDIAIVEANGYDKSMDIYSKNVVLHETVLLADFLMDHLMSHQVEGVRFMWKHAIVGRGGCILAHSMGLGKTIQVVALVFTLFEQLRLQPRMLPRTLLRADNRLRVMIVCPPIVLSNWRNEFQRWIPKEYQNRFPLYLLQSGTDVNYKIKLMELWQRQGGVLLIGYHVLRMLLKLTEEGSDPNMTSPLSVSGSNNVNINLNLIKEVDQKDAKRRNYINQKFKELLLEQGPDLIIADEGHHIKNLKSQLSHQMNRLRCKHRACLTGYPLQNNLSEYYCMIDFCFPKYFVDLTRFQVKYARPINEGSWKDATRSQRQIAVKKLHILGQLIAPIVHRIDNGILRQLLPPKREFIISFNLSPLQFQLYEAYLEHLGRSHQEFLFAKTVVLTRILNHPATLWFGQKGHHSAVWDPQTNKLISGGYYQMLDDKLQLEALEREHMQQGRDGDLLEDSNSDSPEPVMDEGKQAIDLTFAREIYEQNQINNLEHSFKMEALLAIVGECVQAKEHILIFSRSIPTLDFIQSTLESREISFFRMDGDTPQGTRTRMIDSFQRNPETPTAFLISIMTGSLGITLTRASRLIIFDVGWNPCHDEQAIGRIYRFGQTKPTFIYRFQVSGTIEEDLYKLNVHKNSMSLRVLDRRNIEKHFSRQELEHYFKTPSPKRSSYGTWDIVEMRDSAIQDPVMQSLVCINKTHILNVRCHTSFLERPSDDHLDAQGMLEAERTLMEERERLHLYHTQGQIPRDHRLFDYEEQSYLTCRDYEKPRGPSVK